MKKSLILLMIAFTSIILLFTQNVYAVETEVVTFEILSESAITSGTYDLLVDFVDSVYDDVILKVNDSTVGVNSITHNVSNLSIDIYMSDGNQFYVYDDDTYYNINESSNIGDIWVLTFESDVIPITTDMSDIIFMITTFFVGTLSTGLLLLNIDLSTIDVSIGFYTNWFEVDLLTLLNVTVSIFIWIFIIRSTWVILKTIFRKISGR